MILACVDGGIFCIPLMILTAVGLGWCAECIRKWCGRDEDCDCECHEGETDDQKN